MALVQFGNIASAARGSVGGSTFSRNKGGAYVRSRVSPTQPRTSAQRAVRANFSTNSKAWSGTLTAAQRAAWAAYALTYPYINVFGAQTILSGLAMYQAKNAVLALIGQALISSPPVDDSVSAIPIPTALAANHTGGTVVLTTAAQSAAADTDYYIFATPPVPAGRNPSQSAYRFIGSYAPAAAATSVAISTAYNAKYGSLIVGRAVWVVCSQVSISKGNITVGQKLSAVVA